MPRSLNDFSLLTGSSFSKYWWLDGFLVLVKVNVLYFDIFNRIPFDSSHDAMVFMSLCILPKSGGEFRGMKIFASSANNSILTNLSSAVRSFINSKKRRS